MNAKPPDSWSSLAADVVSARALVWAASWGRDAELTPEAHIYFFDRYRRLAEYHRLRGDAQGPSTFRRRRKNIISGECRSSLLPRVGYVASAGDVVIGCIAGHLMTRHGCAEEVQYLFVASLIGDGGLGAAGGIRVNPRNPWLDLPRESAESVAGFTA